MKILKFIAASFLALGLLASCEGYEDYVKDFDFTSTYFGSQKPLRTIVADGDMSFEVGAVLAGMREDNGNYTINYTVDTALLSLIPEAAAFTALPEAYYTLANETTFDIVKDHFRTVKVTLDQAMFTADPLALANTYAIPLRITTASVDSISGSELDTAVIGAKNISIVVVKFISQYHGTYYSRGTQYTLDALGDYADTLTYSKTDLSQNDAIDFSTLGLNTVKTSRIGGNISGGFEYTMNADGSVAVASTDVTIESGAVTYSAVNKTYTLDMTVDKAGTKYHIMEEQILRQNPELDLRFEEW